MYYTISFPSFAWIIVSNTFIYGNKSINSQDSIRYLIKYIPLPTQVLFQFLFCDYTFIYHCLGFT